MYKKDSTSIVSQQAKIGEGTTIWQFCNVMSGVTIGDNCNIGQNVFIETGVSIGNNVTIKNNIAIYAGVRCEDDVFLGPNCVFTNVLTPRSFVSRKDEFKQTIVEKGASIGANATIICGHKIGKYSMIGAGAVVTHDVADYELVVGNPAKKIGYVCQCGERIYKKRGKYICDRCACIYEEQTEGERSWLFQVV